MSTHLWGPVTGPGLCTSSPVGIEGKREGREANNLHNTALNPAVPHCERAPPSSGIDWELVWLHLSTLDHVPGFLLGV